MECAQPAAALITQPAASKDPRFNFKLPSSQRWTYALRPIMKLFYDGACVFCKRETAIIRRLDRHGAHDYIDISELGFNASDYGLNSLRVDRYFTGVSSDGAVTEGPETVYYALKELGFEFLVFPLRFKFIRRLLNPVYKLYACWRAPISNMLGRRCDGACKLDRKR